MKAKMYAVFDQRVDEWFADYYGTADEALQAGAYDWEHLTYHERQRRNAFYVAAVDVIVDDDGSMDDYTVTDILVEYKAYKPGAR